MKSKMWYKWPVLYRYLLIIATMLIAVSLLTGVLSFVGGAGTVEAEEKAQSVVSYQTITLEDGTPYSATTYSDGVLVGYYGLVQIHAMAVMTYQETFTLTPQFSNEPVGCASVDADTGWFVAQEYFPYVAESLTVIASGEETVTVTSTVTSGVLTQGVLSPTIITSDTVRGREVGVLGRCFRVMMEGPGLFTPTVHIRLVNRQ